MIDTIKIQSPVLSEELVLIIEQSLNKKIGMEVKSGHIFYEITQGDLQGSYDRKISVKIDNKKGQKTLIVECSVHKQLLGHNCFHGLANKDLQKGVHFLVILLSNILCCTLPDWKTWNVMRIDVAEIFQLGEDIDKWFRGMNNASYPRRKVAKYGITGIFFSGYSTTIKAYNKHEEYKKNDFKVLSKIDKILAYDVLNKSKGIMRIEVCIKLRKLKYDYKSDIINILDITEEYLNSIYDMEVLKMIQTRQLFEVITESEKVEQRLYSMYKPALAGILLGTWSKLSIFGEEYVKSRMLRNTLYRHKKMLKDIGISWFNTDIIIEEHSLLNNFIPYRNNEKCLTQTLDIDYILNRAV